MRTRLPLAAAMLLLPVCAAAGLSCASSRPAEADVGPFSELERSETTSLLRLNDLDGSAAGPSMALMCSLAQLSLDRGFPFFRVINPEQDGGLEQNQVRLEFFQEIPERSQVVPGDAPADPSGLDPSRILVDAGAILELCAR